MQESIAFLVRVQCRRKKSSRSLSHLLMSFLSDPLLCVVFAYLNPDLSVNFMAAKNPHILKCIFSASTKKWTQNTLGLHKTTYTQVTQRPLIHFPIQTCLLIIGTFLIKFIFTHVCICVASFPVNFLFKIYPVKFSTFSLTTRSGQIYPIILSFVIFEKYLRTVDGGLATESEDCSSTEETGL